MSLGRLVVAAVKVEGRPKAEVARDYGVSRRWVHELIRRFDAEGEAGLESRSRRPYRSPRGTSPRLEDEIIELRNFHGAVGAHGFPASMLTDNGVVFTGAPRGGGRCAIEVELDALGIRYHHSTPYHPQTCGKVERFHQTEKRWLRKQPAVASIGKLQAKLDWFRDYYNIRRPHRALHRRTPAEAFEARPKAFPSRPGLVVPNHCRVRRDRVDRNGRITLRYNSRLHHVGLGRRHAGVRVLALVADLDVRILTEDGELLRTLRLDPSRDYQPLRGP